MSGTGDSDKRRADALQEEVVQLRAQVTRLVEVLNAEKAATAERTRAEVDRRMYEESFRYSEISSQLDRARSEVERLNEENRRLRASSGSLSQSAPGTQMGGGGLDLLDVLPGGLELGSLKRSEWRHIFERLVAELARRKRAGKETTSLSHSSFDFKTENIRTEVDQLSASKLPSVGGGGGALSSDADAFMGFMNKKF